MSHGNVYKIEGSQLTFANQFLKINTTVFFDKSPALEQWLEEIKTKNYGMMILPDGILVNYQQVQFPKLKCKSFSNNQDIEIMSKGINTIFCFWTITSPQSLQFM